MRKFICLIPFVFLSFSLPDSLIKEGDKLREKQIGYLQGDEFATHGITGKGIRIAILDGGFPGVNTHPALKHLIDRKQIVGTWNFVKNREDVYSGVTHGTAVLGCIAGILDGKPLGLAPDAEFLLALTEKSGEPRIEELNWAKAVDWAIKNGANIIQSSLGYTYQRYFTTDLDGRHSIAAQAAARAARKGILIINCNGNEGLTKWKTLATPADADSILSVGAIDPETGLASAFSSIGPTADKRIKPNVCAPGKVLTINSKGGTRIMAGTSFSAPLITGFAACTWQIHRSLSAQEIIALIEKSGHLYPYYDYSHGYGIPQASRVINPGAKSGPGLVSLAADSKNFRLFLREGIKGLPSNMPAQYLYYHISDSSGFLLRYGVYRVHPGDSLRISKAGFVRGDVFRCSFNGETFTWEESK
jgi:subtilisin family serine protease